MTINELIEKLNELNIEWPEEAWLFAANSVLYLMSTNEDGERVMTDRGSVDPRYIITHFAIPSDGGDW